MRAIVVPPGPNFSVQDVYRGWVKGLRACGVEVIEYPFSDRLWHAQRFQVDRDGEMTQAFPFELAVLYALEPLGSWIYETQPDFVLFVSGFWIRHAPYDLIRKRGQKVVLLCTESPYEDDTQAAAAAHTDLTILNDPTNLEAFQSVTDAVYIPHAYDPDVHRPGRRDNSKRSDLCIVGTGYPSRVEFLEQMDLDGLDVALLGHWASLEDNPLRDHVRAEKLTDCIDNDEAVQWYRSTQASLNLYRTESNRDDLSDGWAMSPREVELAAIGTFYLSQPRGENEEVLPMVPKISGPHDASDQLRWWLAHPEARDEIVQKACAAIEHRTFPAHAAQLLDRLEQRTTQ